MRTTVAMVVLPLSSFFLAQRFLFRTPAHGGHWDPDTSLAYAGAVAVAVVNLVMVAFAIWAVKLDPSRDDYDEELFVTPAQARARLAEEQRAAAEEAAKRRGGARMRFAPESQGVAAMLMKLASLMGSKPPGVSAGADAGATAAAKSEGKKKKKVGKKAAKTPAVVAGAGQNNDKDNDEEEEEPAEEAEESSVRERKPKGSSEGKAL
jgi:hypothetical protein